MKLDLPAFLSKTVHREICHVWLARDERLFYIGEPVAHVHFVIHGEVLAVRYLSDGSQAVMQRARGAEFFAHSAMLLPRYTCDTYAACPTQVARLPVYSLREALASDGTFAVAYADQLAVDLRRQCTRVERLRITSARDRVRHHLVCEGAVPADVRLQDWARELGLEPEALYRTLTELEAAGEIA